MPYIDKMSRQNISGRLNEVIYPSSIETAGDLQYAIAVIIKSYMQRKELKYQTCNDVMGALAGAQMEFYRRTVAPYEDQKIEENGDV